jgi:hypothetical protein
MQSNTSFRTTNLRILESIVLFLEITIIHCLQNLSLLNKVMYLIIATIWQYILHIKIIIQADSLCIQI